MIKISALNEESEEENDSEEEVTREALEQIALQQYAKALDLQRKGDIKEAMQLLRDLLDTELLYGIKKPGPGEKAAEPLFRLKYLCYKNIASMQSSLGEVEPAIDSYYAAADLDDTDLTLWHRLGIHCYNAKKYEIALQAFQRGLERNPRHWPCLDKIVTILLGLSYHEDCISVIYDAFKLDPDYLRGLVYREHIYSTLPYVKRFMENLHPRYKSAESVHPFDDEKAAQLLKEAEDIHTAFQEQQKAEQFKYVIPELKLQKPITKLSWCSLGESLVSMHHYMTEHCYSHACRLELVYENKTQEEAMEVCDEPKPMEQEESESNGNNIENEKTEENGSGNENAKDSSDENGKEKPTTDTEKIESDVEMTVLENQDANTPDVTQTPETKEQRKAPVRRRGSDLSFLQQWEWCKNRRSGRRKPVSKDANTDNIYDTLRKMVPPNLVVQSNKKEEGEKSPNTTGIDKLFEERNTTVADDTKTGYFGSEAEQKDVESFIAKYNENKRDIIDILKEYLVSLSFKWDIKWPAHLPKIYVDANKCYSTHIQMPDLNEEEKEELVKYVKVNIMAEEFILDEKLNVAHHTDVHDIALAETVGHVLSTKPHLFSSECLELLLRDLWLKFHINLLNKNEELALDCIYQLVHEFEAMGDYKDFCLYIPNFNFKKIINETEIFAYVKFLERNKRLATVLELYEDGHYEDVLSVLLDSYEYCKELDKNQEDEVALDFSAQLTLILDSYWALRKVEECFQWALTCLHEALKHFFRYTSGTEDYNKWSNAVVKILCSIEHILSTDGLLCLGAVSEKDLSQGLEDLIRIIGYQVETTAADMPLNTVSPWIIMHYILQREADQGRVISNDSSGDEIPTPLNVLFVGHEQLGNRGWCDKNEGKMLFFILDTVVPRLRTPLLSKSLEPILQNMEQCVYCLYGHPSKKNKVKYIEDHNATEHTLNWERAQQIYEIYRPLTLPELQGKVAAITTDTEQLFHRILALMPPEFNLQKYVSDLEKYMVGKDNRLPSVSPVLPYKMKDVYFFLGDYYFKREEIKLANKYNMFDILLNNTRFKAWAQVTLTKSINVERALNSCNNISNEKDFLKQAKTVIRCFKHTLELESSDEIWMEFGVFSYAVHSFCSRLLKQASESLSMEDFESLEKQKEEILNTAQKCFATVTQDLENSSDEEKDIWLAYYMLGKVAEKCGKPPSVYMDYYVKSIKSLHDSDAIYPAKINYSNPQTLAIPVLELHYRIHASILKYLEQHENKPISNLIGKAFLVCIEEWKTGPFTKKPKKNAPVEAEADKLPAVETPAPSVPQAANILKRSISDAGEEHETPESKKIKLDAAKVHRSASCDAEKFGMNESVTKTDANQQKAPLPAIVEKQPDTESEVSKGKTNGDDVTKPEVQENVTKSDAEPVTTNGTKKTESSSSETTSSSDSSSTSSTSDSSSESSRDSDNSNANKPLTDEELTNIISACIEALEDCVVRFPLHYKALYRLAHYHFYFKKGKNIERCRDIMLSNFNSSLGIKIGGLFGERKQNNFFNNIWRIPVSEIDRPGGFGNHMNRCVSLTMEILKEIDDHKTLLDISLQLQKIPEPDKKYLRDHDREELAQQAVSLCVQSLKGQLTKFSQQTDLKCNEVEKNAFNSLMLDIYRAYQRVQKNPNAKQFTNLLVEGFKLVTTSAITENMNLVDLSMRYCQSLIQALKQQATLASLEKTQNIQKKQAAKAPEIAKPVATSTAKKPEAANPTPATPAIPNLGQMSQKDMLAAFQSYMPMLNDPVQAAALSLSCLSNFSAMAGYNALPNPMQPAFQNTLQNSFQAEFYRQFLTQSYSQYNTQPQQKKQKRAPKTQTASTSVGTQAKTVPPKPATQNVPMKPIPIQNKMPQPAPAKPVTVPIKIQPSAPMPSTTTVKTAKSFPPNQNYKATATAPAPSTQMKATQPTPNQTQAKASKPYTQPQKNYPLSLTVTKANSVPNAPVMGKVLPTLPSSLTANLTSTYTQSRLPHPTELISEPVDTRRSYSSPYDSDIVPAHMSSYSYNSTVPMDRPNPFDRSPGKSLQEKLAERQKTCTSTKAFVNATMTRDLSSSLGRLPSSLTVTKSQQPKPMALNKKPKPSITPEVIVLDDD